MIHRDEDGTFFKLRLTPRIWIVVGRWNVKRPPPK